MTDTQKEALARLARLAKQTNPSDLDDVYSEQEDDEWVGPRQYQEDLEVVGEMLARNEFSVYVVGSWDRYESVFKADRVYGPGQLEEAIAYSNSRANNDGQNWNVFETRPGLDWIGWTVVHHTPRI